MSVQISYKKQVIFYILLILVVLAAIEMILRVNEQINPRCNFLGNDALDDLDLEIQKNMCKDYIELEYKKINGFNVHKENQYLNTVNINSLGTRGNEISLDKDLDVTRIIILGGSTVFGDGASSDENTISGFLKREFEKNGNSNIEIINAGVGGMDSDGEVMLLTKKYTKLKPDIVVVYDGWNDIRQEKFNKAGGIGLTQEILKYYKTPQIVYRTFFSDTKLIQFDFEPKFQDIAVENWLQNWKNVCNNSQRDYKIVVSVQPLLTSGKQVLSEDEKKFVHNSPFIAHQTYGISQIAEKVDELNGICDKTIDLTGTFDNVSESIFFDYGHMSDKGNQIIAKKIFLEINSMIVS